MLQWWEHAIEPHWPFLVAAFVFMLVGQVMKKSVFTRPRAYARYLDELPNFPSYLAGQSRVARRFQKFWWWAYKTLPLHPVAAGIILGVFVSPEPGIEGSNAMLYFAGAGAASVFLYQLLKGLLKRRGVELDPLPGQSLGPFPKWVSERPPAPPKVPEDVKVMVRHDDPTKKTTTP